MGTARPAPRGGNTPALLDLEILPRSRVRSKKTRILRLYERQPKGGAVICFDEWGPLELRPMPGIAWARAGLPLRQRATYPRTQGTEQFLGFYGVHADCPMGTCRRRKPAYAARARAAYRKTVGQGRLDLSQN